MAKGRVFRRSRAAFVAIAVALGGLGYSAPVAASCSGDATVNGCSPGSGSTAVNCAAEWLLTPEPSRDGRGIPRSRTTCFEGDPGCDFDAETDVCTFQLSLCINN